MWKQGEEQEEDRCVNAPVPFEGGHWVNSLLSAGVLQKEQVKSYPPAPLLQCLPDTTLSEGERRRGNQPMES